MSQILPKHAESWTKHGDLPHFRKHANSTNFFLCLYIGSGILVVKSKELVMTEEQRQQHVEQLHDLADKLLADKLAEGHPFSEGLCNWAVSTAEQTLGSPQ